MKKYKIAILLATHNGEEYLEQQLNSLISLKNVDVQIYASDDSSQDKTVKILQKYKIKKIFKNSFKSFTKNFAFLINNVEENYDFYAFCDQDDIWESNKFVRAIEYLDSGYNLYCSTTKIINSGGELIDHSTKWKKKLSFANALFQSIAGGNTMVFDNQILRLLKEKNNLEFISHDWWVYIISSFSGKKIYFDHKSYVLYRQHNNNKIGSSKSFFGKIERYIKALKGFYIKCNDLHQNNIQQLIHLGTEENKKIFENFKKMRIEKNPFTRLLLMYKSKFYRQTTIGSLALYSLVLIGRI